MAAQAGTITLIGKSRRTYTIDLYLPDATGTAPTYNMVGLASSTSPNSFRIPEDCIIYDISVTASPTAVGAVFNVNSGALNGGTVRWSNQLQTLANRQKLNIPLRGGDFLSAIQF